MLRATLRSLFARRLRLLLSAFAVVLGVAFVSGAFVLTDTMKGFFDHLFASTGTGTAVTVQGTSALGGGERADREPVPQAVLDRVREVPGVAEVIGQVRGYAQVVKANGKALSTGGAPSRGLAYWNGSPQEVLKIKQGHAPTEPNEVAVDESTAQRAHLRVGQQITVLLKGPAVRVTLVGLMTLGNASNIGGASLIAFDPTTAQRLVGLPGTWSALSVAAAPGVDEAKLRARIANVLPSGFEALTHKQTVDDRSKELKRGLNVFTTVLLVFAAVALFVGMFLIFNTFSMLVAQRTRELALMRALGASRGQVTRSVLLEAVVVGLTGALVGFAAGIGVAWLIREGLNLVGIDLPAGSTVIKLRTLIVSLAVGLGVTVVAALVPARRAARVAPVQAMRDSGPAEDRSLRRRAVLGAVVLAAGVLALSNGLNGGGIQLVGLGVVLSFLGVATLSPLFARRAVFVLGAPLAPLGAPSRLGRGNAMRSPRRTSATAAALMVGLALVAVVSTFGESTKKSLAAYVDRSLGADYVLHSDQFQPFSPEVGAVLRSHPEFKDIAVYTQGDARIAGHRVTVQGVAAAPLVATLKVQTLHGDLTSIDRGELAVSDTEATAHRFHVGQTVDVIWSRTGSRPLRIGAIFKQNLFAGAYLVGPGTYDRNVTQRLAVVVAVTVKPTVTPQQARAAVDASVKAFPNLVVEDQAALVRSDKQQVDSLLNVVTGLLVFSVLIAVLGIINTLALSVVERTRELGMLRAVGLSRRQTRRMIRVESVLIAIFGAVLGIGVGLAFGRALVSALHDQGIDQFAIPYTRLLWVLVGAGFGGVVAAALPARRAARLDVLAAIAHE